MSELPEVTQKKIAALEAMETRAKSVSTRRVEENKFHELRLTKNGDKVVRIRNVPLLEEKNKLSLENRKIREELSRLKRTDPERAEKIKFECVMKHIEEQRKKGNLIQTAAGEQRGPNFEPHPLAEINEVMYGTPYNPNKTRATM